MYSTEQFVNIASTSERKKYKIGEVRCTDIDVDENGNYYYSIIIKGADKVWDCKDGQFHCDYKFTGSFLKNVKQIDYFIGGTRVDGNFVVNNEVTFNTHTSEKKRYFPKTLNQRFGNNIFLAVLNISQHHQMDVYVEPDLYLELNNISVNKSVTENKISSRTVNFLYDIIEPYEKTNLSSKRIIILYDINEDKIGVQVLPDDFLARFASIPPKLPKSTKKSRLRN